MKTAVSIPDDVYEQTEKTARQLGVPRSRLITQALREFLCNHEESQITQRLNEAHKETQLDRDTDSVSVENLRRLTRDDTW
jgi:metal-responsive CopG/Arc/MetJ family transcriptional regulator